MPFEKLLFQDSATKFLEASIAAKKIPHAMIFYGPEGVGKKLCALCIASYLLYPEKIPEEDKKRIFSETHPDLRIIKPEGKIALHPIDALRAMIEEAALATFEVGAKVFIIEDAHRMLPASANILLKILEEPINGRYFILLTSDIDALLPTITSRCTRVKFHAIDEKQILQFLLNEHKASECEARELSKLALGSLGEALYLLKDSEYQNKFKELMSLIFDVLHGDFIQWSERLEEFEEKYMGKDEDLDDEKILQRRKNVDLVFRQIGLIFRDLKLLQENRPKEFFTFPSYFTNIQSQDIAFLPPIDVIMKYLKEAKQGFELNIPLKACLEAFFLRIHS